jgi:hypothetical protein
MSTAENREKALATAVALSTAHSTMSWQTAATDALNFLETGSFTPVQPAGAVAADPTPAAPRKPRAPAASAPTTAPVDGSAQPAKPIEAAATPNKAPTLDDVRTALVQLQTRSGSKAASQKILDSYTAPKQGITGNVPPDKYAALIAELASA